MERGTAWRAGGQKNKRRSKGEMKKQFFGREKTGQWVDV